MSSAQVTTDDWERYKPMLWQLWIQKNMSAEKLRHQMGQRYSFVASKQAFDRQFKAWVWQKNLTPQQWFVVGQHVKKRKQDESKASEVRFNGEVIQLEPKLKKKRLTYAEEIRLSQQQSLSLPESVLVYTPNDQDQNKVRTDNIPWNLFMHSARDTIQRLAGPRGAEPMLSLNTFNSSSKPLQQCNIVRAMESVEDTTLVSPNSDPLRASIYSIANNFRSTILKGRFLKAEISEMFDTLEKQSSQFINEAFSNLTGTTFQSFMIAIIAEAFWRNDARVVELLLPLATFDINEKIRLDQFEVVSLVDMVKSAEMATLFAKCGGNLARAEEPFLRLDHLDLPATQLHGIYGKLIEVHHDDVHSSASCILSTQDPNLVWSVIENYSLRPLTLAQFMVFLLARDHPAGDLLGPGWLSTYGPTILSLAAFVGREVDVAWLIRRSVALNETKTIQPSPKLEHGRRVTLEQKSPRSERGTALQFALSNKHSSISRMLIDAGADIAVAPSTTLPTPFEIAEKYCDDSLALHLISSALNHHDQEAPRFGEYRLDQTLFEHRLSKNTSPLTFAARRGQLDLAERLLAAGCDVNAAFTSEQERPLAWAILHEDTVLAHRFLDLGAKFVYDWRKNDLSLWQKRNLLTDVVCRNIISHFEGRFTADDLETAEHFGDQPTIMLTPLTAALGLSRIDLYNPIDPDSHRVEDCALVKHIVEQLGCKTADTAALPSPLAVAILVGCTNCLQVVRTNRATVTTEDLDWAAAMIGPSQGMQMLLHYYHCSRLKEFSETCSCLTMVKLSHNCAKLLLSHWSMINFFSESSTWFDGQYDDKLFADWDADHNEDDDINLEAQLQKATYELLNVDWESPCMSEALGWTDWSPAKLTMLLDLGVKPSMTAGACSETCESQRSQNLPVSDMIKVFHELCEKGELSLVVRFLEAGADPNRATYNHIFSDVVANSGVAIGDQTRQTTPLVGAAQAGHVEVMRELIKHGGAVHYQAQGSYGRTALQAAVEGGHPAAMCFLIHEHEASVNEPPARNGGLTALQIAAMTGRTDIALGLIGLGAHVNAARAEKNGYTALEAAAKLGRLDMVQLLINAGADISDQPFGSDQFIRAVNHAREEGFQPIARLLQEEKSRLHQGRAAAETQGLGELLVQSDELSLTYEEMLGIREVVFP